MANDITELRDTLFDTLRQLKDPKNPMPIERAKTIGDIAQVVINTAKVEIQHMQLTKGRGTGFIRDLPLASDALPGPANETPTTAGPAQPLPAVTSEEIRTGTKSITRVPGATITRHKMS